MSPKHFWQPDEDEMILRLRDEGKNAREIGEAMGRTRLAVNKRLARLRQPNKTELRLKAENDRIVELRRAGRSIAEIAADLHRSKETIRTRLIFLDVENHELPEPSERTAATVHGAHLENYHRARRGFHVPAGKQDQYFALLKTGTPIAEAARRLGLSGGASS